MPRAQRKTETEAFKPLINFEKTVYEKVSLKLSEPVVANLKAYAAYVQTSVGSVPTLDEIVDKGMQRLFDADKGFRNWLQKQNGAAPPTEKAIRAETDEELEQAAAASQSFGQR